MFAFGIDLEAYLIKRVYKTFVTNGQIIGLFKSKKWIMISRLCEDERGNKLSFNKGIIWYFLSILIKVYQNQFEVWEFWD